MSVQIVGSGERLTLIRVFETLRDLGQATHRSASQALISSKVLNRGRGVKKRSRTKPTWFST